MTYTYTLQKDTHYDMLYDTHKTLQCTQTRQITQ